MNHQELNLQKLLWGNFYGALVGMAMHPGNKTELNLYLDYYAYLADQMLLRYKAREETWTIGFTKKNGSSEAATPPQAQTSSTPE